MLEEYWFQSLAAYFISQDHLFTAYYLTFYLHVKYLYKIFRRDKN